MKSFAQFQKHLKEAALPAEPGELIDILLNISTDLMQLETSASSILTHLKASSGDGGSKFEQVYSKIEKLAQDTTDILKEIREDITAGVLGANMAQDKNDQKEEERAAKLASMKGQGNQPAKPKAKVSGGDTAPGKDLKSK